MPQTHNAPLSLEQHATHPFPCSCSCTPISSPDRLDCLHRSPPRRHHQTPGPAGDGPKPRSQQWVQQANTAVSALELHCHNSVLTGRQPAIALQCTAVRNVKLVPCWLIHGGQQTELLHVDQGPSCRRATSPELTLDCPTVMMRAFDALSSVGSRSLASMSRTSTTCTQQQGNKLIACQSMTH